MCVYEREISPHARRNSLLLVAEATASARPRHAVMTSVSQSYHATGVACSVHARACIHLGPNSNQSPNDPGKTWGLAYLAKGWICLTRSVGEIPGSPGEA